MIPQCVTICEKLRSSLETISKGFHWTLLVPTTACMRPCLLSLILLLLSCQALWIAVYFFHLSFEKFKGLHCWSSEVKNAKYFTEKRKFRLNLKKTHNFSKSFVERMLHAESNKISPYPWHFFILFNPLISFSQAYSPIRIVLQILQILKELELESIGHEIYRFCFSYLQ